jgi:uncharacterized protein YegJ (DUF2314 family)
MDKNKINTEWELNNNVVSICKDCWKERKKKWQDENKNLEVHIGDFVKLGVYDKKVKDTEHLWFKVVTINQMSKRNIEYVGVCNNVPVVIENLKYGDKYVFKFKDIEEYLTGENK